MASSARQVALEVESLEGRLVPTVALVQSSGGVINIQGLDTPNLVHVFTRGTKVIVQVIDLSTGLQETESFTKSKIHNVEFHQSANDDSFLLDDFHGKGVESEQFSHEGVEVGDDNPGGGSNSGGGNSGHDG